MAWVTRFMIWHVMISQIIFFFLQIVRYNLYYTIIYYLYNVYLLITYIYYNLRFVKDFSSSVSYNVNMLYHLFISSTIYEKPDG